MSFIQVGRDLAKGAIFLSVVGNGIDSRARRKQFRIGPAKIKSSAESASTLGGSGGMLPRKILKFIFSKMCIWRILREN